MVRIPTGLFALLFSWQVSAAGNFPAAGSIPGQDSPPVADSVPVVDSLPTTDTTLLGSCLRFLAADSLQGRAAGTRGNQLAAAFIADRFREAGLHPLLNNSYYDTIPRYTGDTLYSCNLLGILPGTSRPEEWVLITAHFDHLPPGPRNKIYNGANDNASGTAALLALLKIFAAKGATGRSLVFCAFNMEEKGLVGSAALASKLPAEKIVALINLEMLGYPQVGRNRFFMTGEKESDLARLFRHTLQNSGIRLVGERGDLFQRSDNYPFAKKGIPAHSLMASTDAWRCYHQPCDDIERLDIPNLAALVNGIARAILPVAAAIQTPKRINRERL